MSVLLAVLRGKATMGTDQSRNPAVPGCVLWRVYQRAALLSRRHCQLPGRRRSWLEPRGYCSPPSRRAAVRLLNNRVAMPAGSRGGSAIEAAQDLSPSPSTLQLSPEAVEASATGPDQTKGPLVPPTLYILLPHCSQGRCRPSRNS